MDGIFPPDPSPNAPHSRLDRAFLHTKIDQIIEITNTRILPDLEPDSDIAMIGFVIDHDGVICATAMLVPMPEVTPRHMEDIFRKFLKDQGAGGYIVHFMGWMAEGNYSNLAMESGTFVPPSQHPDRIEVLTIAAGSDMANASRVYEAVRDQTRRIVRLDERTGIRDTASSDSLFCDLLGRK